MTFPKKLAKRLGHKIPVPKRQRRRLEREARRLTRAKPKRPVPSLGRNQKPLETVAEAKREIAAVRKFSRDDGKKFVAFTNLLSRAYLGERNPEVIRLIEKARDKIQIKWVGEKPVRKRVERPFPLNRLSEETQSSMDSLKFNLEKENFGQCLKIVGLLTNDTPRKESRIVASLLESSANSVGVKLHTEENPKKRADYFETILKLYAASGFLYKKGGSLNKAAEVFNSADTLKARFKLGL